MSDFKKFICHPDFKTVLQLADLLRFHKAKLDCLRDHEGLQSSFSAQSSPSQPSIQKSASGDSRSDLTQSRGVGNRESYAYDNAAELLRSSLLPPSNSRSIAMERGECVITDSLIDETIESLADELRFYLDIKKQRRAHQRSHISAPISNVGYANFLDTKSGVKEEVKSNPIADKFSKIQFDILTDWMIAHRVRDDVRAFFLVSHHLNHRA